MTGLRVWGALVGAGLLVASSAARAEEGVFMRDLLGKMGIIESNREPIDYRERAPLVLPPRQDLREPSQKALAARDPQWPKDPDVAARRGRAEDNGPVHLMERRRALDNNTRLSIDEIRSGRRPGAEVPDAPVARPGDNNRLSTWVHPDELRATARKEEVATGSEPTRKSLTEPPSGFRAPRSGKVVRADSDPVLRLDEADPKAYIRQQNSR